MLDVYLVLVAGNYPFRIMFKNLKIKMVLNREGVGTSNFRATTGHFFQNVEIVFLVYHYYDITTSKMAFELITTTTIRTSKIDFRRSDLSQRHR